MRRLSNRILVSSLKLSVTGDTAKYLVFNSAEVVHFHLKTHPTREKDETRFLGREIHPYPPDPFPPILCYISLSGQQDEPPQLTPSWQSPYTIRLHGKPTKTVKTYKSLCSRVAVHNPDDPPSNYHSTQVIH